MSDELRAPRPESGAGDPPELPPPLGDEEVRERLRKPPPVPATAEERARPAEERIQMAHTLPDLYEPTAATLPLFRGVEGMLRRFWWASRSGPDEGAPRRPRPREAGSWLHVVGPSMSGKTAALWSVLATYPQVVEAPVPGSRGRPLRRLVWLYCEMPPEPDSPRALTRHLVAAWDQATGGSASELWSVRRPPDERAVATLLRCCALGLLVIDVDRLALSPRRVRALASLARAVPEVPLVTVSSPAGLLEDVRFRPLEGEGELSAFVEAIWPHQYVRDVEPLADGHLTALADATFGLPGLVVGVFARAQVRAIEEGTERLTPELLAAVSRECP